MRDRFSKVDLDHAWTWYMALRVPVGSDPLKGNPPGHRLSHIERLSPSCAMVPGVVPSQAGLSPIPESTALLQLLCTSESWKKMFVGEKPENVGQGAESRCRTNPGVERGPGQGGSCRVRAQSIFLGLLSSRGRKCAGGGRAKIPDSPELIPPPPFSAWYPISRSVTMHRRWRGRGWRQRRARPDRCSHGTWLLLLTTVGVVQGLSTAPCSQRSGRYFEARLWIPRAWFMLINLWGKHSVPDLGSSETDVTSALRGLVMLRHRD